jgi:thioredoxin-related protein
MSLPVARRRKALLWAAAVLLPRVALAAETALPVPQSLFSSAGEALARGEPLVLLVSLPGCPFCEVVRRNYLLPLRREGLAAWQIDINDTGRAIAGFDGRASSGARLAAGWKIRVTPTLLFLDRQGTELAPRLEGIAVPDFYGAYLDEALATARRRLRP